MHINYFLSILKSLFSIKNQSLFLNYEFSYPIHSADQIVFDRIYLKCSHFYPIVCSNHSLQLNEIIPQVYHAKPRILGLVYISYVNYLGIPIYIQFELYPHYLLDVQLDHWCYYLFKSRCCILHSVRIQSVVFFRSLYHDFEVGVGIEDLCLVDFAIVISDVECAWQHFSELSKLLRLFYQGV